MAFCSCINKIFLVILNFIVFAVGVGVITLASIVIHRGSEYSQLLSEGVLTLPVWTLIAGIAVTLIGFFGCCGAIKESKCMLWIYASIVTLLFLAELTLGILIALYPEKAKGYIHEAMENTFSKYNTEDTALKNAINVLQHDLECCGVEGPLDWVKWNIVPPKSCCKNPSSCIVANPLDIYQEGCFDAIVEDLMAVTIALGVTAIILGIVQVFCICVACTLANKRYQYV